MYWTLELASKLEDAPWPATKDELIDYAVRSGAPLEVLENLQEIEDEGEIYESIEDIWPDYPSKDDFFFNEDAHQFTFKIFIPSLCFTLSMNFLNKASVQPLVTHTTPFFHSILVRLLFANG